MDRNRRMIVLHVIEGLGTGGAEGQLAAFLLRSDAGRFQHVVCTLAQVGRFADVVRAVGVPVHTLGVRADGDMGRAFVRLLHVTRRVNPDVIHTVLYRPTITGRLVGRLCRKPVVTTLVNTTYEPEWRLDNPSLHPYKVWAVQTLDRITARGWGSRYIAITEAVKASAVRQLGLSPAAITVIPRGLTFERDATSGHVTDARARLGWDGYYPVILNLARLVPQKGQQYAIRAMRDLLPRYPSAHLVIAGGGPLRAALEQLIRDEGLEAHVTLLGDRHDASVLLPVADIFVFPSLFEGLGNALLEAMAARKPCVVSDIPTLREVTGDGQVALLAALRSPADLARQLLQLADDRARAARLGHAAQVWVRERYDIAKSVTALEAVYEEIRAPRRATSSPLVLIGMRALDTRRAGVLRVLTYHRVCDPARGLRGDPHVVSATPDAFDAQMAYVARHYTPVTAAQVVTAVHDEASLPPRAVLVTFDDGYRDVMTAAWPIMKRHGVPGVLFVPTAFPGSRKAFWWDELWEIVSRSTAAHVRLFGLEPLPLRCPQERWLAVRALNRVLKAKPAELASRLQRLRDELGPVSEDERWVLDWDELRRLARDGLAIGSHTRTHPNLPALTLGALEDEISTAHADLEREVGGATPLFAYPYGHADLRAVPVLRRLGYAAAFISLLGRNIVGRRDVFLLYRHSVDLNDSLARFAASLTTLYVGIHESGRDMRARVRRGLSRSGLASSGGAPA